MQYLAYLLILSIKVSISLCSSCQTQVRCLALSIHSDTWPYSCLHFVFPWVHPMFDFSGCGCFVARDKLQKQGRAGKGLLNLNFSRLTNVTNLFIPQDSMEADRASWGSYLQALPLSARLPVSSRRLNSSWWTIIGGIKVQKERWPLPLSCL